MIRIIGGAFCLVSLTLGACPSIVIAQEPLKSGPESRLPGHFHALVVNGPSAARVESMVWLTRGYKQPRPYWLIFVRDIDDATLALIKKLDEEQAQSEKFRVGVVLLAEFDVSTADSLASLAENAKIRAAVFSLRPSGLKEWKISEDAAITVVFSNTRQEVVVNFAYRKGEFNGRQVDRIINAAKKGIATQ